MEKAEPGEGIRRRDGGCCTARIRHGCLTSFLKGQTTMEIILLAILLVFLPRDEEET